MQEILSPLEHKPNSIENDNNEGNKPCLLAFLSGPGQFSPVPLPDHPAHPGKGREEPPEPKTPDAAVQTKAARELETHALQTVPTSIVEHTAHRSGKWVALTFDDGPNPTYTPQVLAILKQYGIHATFCLVGQEVKRYPGLVKEIAAAGHKLADHTMDHDEFLPRRSEARIRSEILGDKNLINSIVPDTPVEYYRAPGGNWSTHIRQLSSEWGMKPLGWSVDTRDWTRPGVNAILNTVARELRPGGVILMHDAGGNRSQSVEALKELIPTLKKEGYQFDFPQ